MKPLLREDLHVPGPDWTSGPYTTVGEISPDKPRTLFDMQRSKDNTYPNNTRVPQIQPSPGQNLLELLANFNMELNDIKNIVKSSAQNPVVQKNDKLKKEALIMLKRLNLIGKQILEIEQLLRDYKIAPENEERHD